MVGNGGINGGGRGNKKGSCAMGAFGTFVRPIWRIETKEPWHMGP